MTLKSIAAAMMLAVCLSAGNTWAAEYTGKVVAVFHEHVKVNNAWLDKVSVTLDNCATPGQLVTVHYAPGDVSEANYLGFLFRDLTNSARANVTKNQYMNIVNGHATVLVNDQNQVQKTTFWGYNWECGQNIGVKTASSGASVPAAAGNTPAPASSSQPAKKSRFGVGVPGVGRFGL